MPVSIKVYQYLQDFLMIPCDGSVCNSISNPDMSIAKYVSKYIFEFASTCSVLSGKPISDSNVRSGKLVSASSVRPD